MSNPTDKASVALLPCPFCGERLVEKSDHHGKWWAHRNEPGPCIDSVTQLFDADDFTAWNTRALSPGDGMRDALVNLLAAYDGLNKIPPEMNISHAKGRIAFIHAIDAARAALASHPDRQPGMTDEILWGALCDVCASTPKRDRHKVKSVVMVSREDIKKAFDAAIKRASQRQ